MNRPTHQDDERTEPQTDQERELLALYRNLDETDRGLLQWIALVELGRQESTEAEARL